MHGCAFATARWNVALNPARVVHRDEGETAIEARRAHGVKELWK